jgi:hypothetical protein
MFGRGLVRHDAIDGHARHGALDQGDVVQVVDLAPDDARGSRWQGSRRMIDTGGRTGRCALFLVVRHDDEPSPSMRSNTLGGRRPVVVARRCEEIVVFEIRVASPRLALASDRSSGHLAVLDRAEALPASVGRACVVLGAWLRLVLLEQFGVGRLVALFADQWTSSDRRARLT